LDRIKHLIVLLVLLSTQFTKAQQTISLDETVFIHANAMTFVSGETLLYKIYCLRSTDKTPSNISKIAYIELVDNTKKSVFKTKVSLENSVGQGDYFIPTTLKTGSYKLIGYTNWMLNKPVSELFQLEINIVNPYKATEKSIAGNSHISNNVTSSNNSESALNPTSFINDNVKLNLNKKTFTNRELVDLNIESSNTAFTDGNYSLSVRKLDNIPSKNQISANDFVAKPAYPVLLDLQNHSQKIILPEIRGEIIAGKITAQNVSDKIEDISVALSIPGKSFVFKVVKTDAQGNFIFNINKTYYTSDIVVQVIDEKASNYNLTINNNPEIDYSKLSNEQNVNISYIMKESLLERSISSQVENAYYHMKVNNIEKTPTLEAFYYPLSKEYILDEFTRFKTLKETMTEVSTEIYHKQVGDKIYLHVNDPSVFPQFPDAALVLVDGLYLENQNDLMTYNMKNVYKIEVIAGRYYVGSKSFNGLISFTTFDKDFKSIPKGNFIAKPTILRPQPKKIYNKVQYTNQGDNARIPDFRNQLFWNPKVALNNKNNNSFYTSDLSGTFEIRLEGFAKNGSPVSLREIIEVKDTSN
jgi:hypothetical protein